MKHLSLLAPCPGGFFGRLVLFTLLLALACQPAVAAIRTWDGDPSTSSNWSVPGNWAEGSAPVNGDTVIFPAGLPAADLLTTNNITGLRLDLIQFSGGGGGYFVRGNSLILSNGLTAAQSLGNNTVDLDLTLGRAQTFLVSDAQGVLTINGDIALNGFDLTVNAAGTNNLNGIISGTGDITKNGSGRLVLGGLNNPNTFVGDTRLNVGTLQLSRFVIISVFPDFITEGRVTVPGNLFVGDGTGTDLVVETAENQIADTATVTIADTATFQLDDVSDAIAALAMNGGLVTTGTGTLTNGNITTTASATTATISGNLHLGNFTRTFDLAAGLAADELSISANISGGGTGSFPTTSFAGIIKEGTGRLVLSGANTYSGPTTINEGFVRVTSDTALGGTFTLGSSFPGTTINPDGQLALSAVGIGNEPLIINSPAPDGALSAGGVCSWSGPITLNSNALFTTGGTLALSNVISGAGSLELDGTGLFRFAGSTANTFAGDVLLSGGTLELAKPAVVAAVPHSITIGEPGDSASVKTVRHLNASQIINHVVINCSGVLDLNNNTETIANLTLAGGTVNTGTGTLTVSGNIFVTEGLAPCGDNFINGELSFTAPGPHFINLPVTSLALGAPDLFINAAILSSPELRITGNSGRVFLRGANTFAGLLRLESTSGDLIVRLENVSALGGIAAGTILDGVQLELRGFVYADEPLTNVNAGTLIRTFGNNNHGGPIVLNADLLVTNTAAITEFAGAIAGANFDVTKTGTGTLRFSGASANTFGTMFVNQGLFEMNKTAGVTAASPLVIGDGVNSATARNFQSSQTDEVTVNSGSLWDLNGNNDAINPLVLDNGGDVTTGTGTLTFGVAGSITVTGGPFGLAGTASAISGNLNLGSSGTRTISVVERVPLFISSDSTELIISAVVSGAAGFTKTGAGDMSLSGANTFTGAVTVNDGELLISSDTALGTIAGGVSVTGDGVLQMSGDISVGAEPLTLNSTGQSAFLDNVGALHSSGGSNSWAGNITLSQTARISVVPNAHINLLGIISGPGGVTKEQPGTLIYSGVGPNTYAGITRVEAGTLELRKVVVDGAVPGDLIIGDGNGGELSDVVRVVGIAQIATASDVTMNSSGLLDLNDESDGISTLAGSGRVDFGAAGTGALVLNGNGSAEYSGLIIGAGLPTGALIKRGTGTFTLSGNNTYTGTNRVENGTLLVNGSQPSSDVLVLTGATLGGNGRVGDLKVNNIGNLAPGASPGQLTSANTKLDPASNFRVELNGSSAGAGYDVLNVIGTLDLNGALLLPTKTAGYAPADGAVHTIIINNAADAITGTFGGRPEGSIVTLGLIDFRLSYVGGTGNDVTLTVTNIPLAFASARVEAGNGNGRIDPGECDHLFIALENLGGTTISGISARLDSLNPSVAVTQPESAYPNIAALGFGTNTTPFQLRITPDFLCGQNVQLSLVVTATGEGTFAVPFTLNSGAPGGFAVINSTNVPKAILDLDTTNSLIIVTNQFPIRKVRVSLHATHPAAGDLRFRLRSPLGTEVLLSANRGGNVANYGNACGARTIFDDDALTKITAASAPFAGTFAPEENLAAFIGLNSSGTWRLFVDDTVAGDTGTLQCWSLSLAPGVCTEGGGECESCLATIAGTLTPASPTLPERIFRTGDPSGCGNIKLCPGGTVSLSSITTYRYNTHTFANTGPDTCVTVVLTVPCADPTNALISAAYLDQFLPPDLCANYLGDSGNDVAGGSIGYSFRVPAGERFVVMVHELNPDEAGQGCGNYTLQLYGLPCPPPVLHISHVETPPNRVRLFWSTAYPGFQLQRSPHLNGAPPFPFVNVPGAPFVIGGDYNVTNSATANDDYFRLRKP